MPAWPTPGACPSGRASTLMVSATATDQPDPVGVGPSLTASTAMRPARAP